MLLLLLLTLFSISNYQREKELIGEALEQKGLTLMRFINSSARESMRANINSAAAFVRWEDHVQAAMEQAVEQPGVDYVLLVNIEGSIVSGAGENVPQGKVDNEVLAFIHRLKPKIHPPFVSRTIREERGGGKQERFQIVSWHLPPTVPGMERPLEKQRGRGQMMRRFMQHPDSLTMQDELKRLRDQQLFYLVQLDLAQFNASLQRQLLQILLLAVVTLLVGVGGALSYATLKGLKGSQQSLGNMRAFTDILVSSLPVGLIATDKAGTIQVCNPSAGEILGVEIGDILFNRPESCLPGNIVNMFVGHSAVDSLERQREIYIHLDEDKTLTLQVTSMVVLDNNSQFSGEVLLIRDLTKVKLLEKELQRSERLAVLGKMAAGVAHELRNPLSSIKGLALLLKSQFITDGKATETAEILVKEVDRLNRGIGELLDYAKPGQLKRELSAIVEVIEKTVSLIEIDAKTYGIDINVDIQDDLSLLQIDRDKLNQVFLNLLLNAIQAMPDGGTLAIKARQVGPTVIVSIKDTGVGITPENLPRIFDPYFTTKSEGTGLGLAISMKIVEEHGGTIKVASIPNVDTEFQVLLPV